MYNLWWGYGSNCKLTSFKIQNLSLKLWRLLLNIRNVKVGMEKIEDISISNPKNIFINSLIRNNHLSFEAYLFLT